MRFSLIVATLDRPNDLKNLLESLVLQTYKDFQVIIVDQSDNKDSFKIVDEYRFQLDIIYLHSEIKGLSIARNVGLSLADGDIIAFPDDDCCYSANVLELVSKHFLENASYHIISTNSQASIRDNSKYHSAPSSIRELNVWNIFSTIISFTLFIRNNEINILKFDESFGVGAQFGSGEETDLILRLIKEGAKGCYFPDVMVFHPVNKINSIERGYKYALGFGALHRKHFNLWAIKAHFILYTLSSLLKILLFRDIKMNYFLLKGKIKGFYKFNI
jgi:glycosyltransferase involved in cell wall biosynthesis